MYSLLVTEPFHPLVELCSTWNRMCPSGSLLSCLGATRTPAKDPGISHTTVLRKLKRRGCTPIWLSGMRSET